MRKWAIGVAAVLVAAVLGLAGYVLATALRSEHPVGYQTVDVKDPDGKPFQVGIWYPTDAFTWPKLTGLLVQFVATDAPVAGKAHPLIILSHGIAGSLGAHADTALALADAGFVVAAPLHTGDNYKDQSAIGTKDWFPVRARQAHLTISYMVEEWRGRSAIDADKIGMFGFSGGGTTALIALGARPDPDAARAHCATSKEFGCQLWKAKHEMVPVSRDLIHDPRIKSAVIIAPGAGFAFGGYGYVPHDVPVQLWGGEKDESVPTPSNAAVVHRALPEAEWHLVPNAGHFSFMVPCGPVRFLTSAPICKDPPGFDRAAFHKTFNAAVVAFFQKTLAKAPRFVCVGMVCVTNDLIYAVVTHSPASSFDVFGIHVGDGAHLALPDDVTIDIFKQDWFGEFSRDSVEPACSKSWCIFYHKYCPAPPYHRCSYVLSRSIPNDAKRETQPAMTGIFLDVSVNNPAGFLEAENKIALRSSQGLGVEFIPLRYLTRKFDTFDPAVCDHRIKSKGCIWRSASQL